MILINARFISVNTINIKKLVRLARIKIGSYKVKIVGNFTDFQIPSIATTVKTISSRVAVNVECKLK